MTAGRTHPLVLAFVLGLAAFLLYVPSLGSGFVYDAEAQIKSNDYIHTPSHFLDVVTLRVLGQDVLDGTRPVHLFFLMTDSLLWGRHPFGYHLTSNLLHALNAVLLFLLLVRLGARDASNQNRILGASFLATILFIVHPVLVEAVSEVSDREDLLAVFFLLASLLLATHFPSRSRGRSFLFGAGCVWMLLLAAGSKETGFAGPLLLALQAGVFSRPGSRRSWAILLATAFVAVGIFAVERFSLPPEVSAIFTEKPSYLGGSLVATLSIQPRIWTLLFANVAWPLHLSADYGPQNVAWITLPEALIVLAALLAAQIFLSFKSRLVLLGTGIFWLGLAPVSNFIPIFRPIGDRFLYMPMAGLAAFLCGALLLVHGRMLFSAACATLAIAELSLVPITLRRQAVFANSLALWRDTTAKSPFSVTAADNLGYALNHAGKYEEALPAFGRALGLANHANADAWAGAAIALARMDRTTDAVTALQKAIALDPRYADPAKLVENMVIDPESARTLDQILARFPSTSPPP